MRVVSLLPAATEIVAALGCGDALVGTSHECDFPPEVARLPRVTHGVLHGNALPSAEIDRRVSEALATTGTLYTLDEALMRRLAPELIVTQALCDVCAVGWSTVRDFAATLPGPPRVLSLEPESLAGVLADVRTVAAALGEPARGEALVASLRARLDAVRRRVAGAPLRRCVVLEWLDPPYATGHWGPELVTIAGGHDPLGRPGAKSAPVAWDEVVASAPEVLVLACCGFDVARTRAELDVLRGRAGWDTLPAVRAGDVWIADGAAYFSRPGPRVVDACEILSRLLHPDRWPDGGLPAGVERA